LGLRRPSPPQAGPASSVDDNGDTRTPQPCPSLVLQAGATAQSWRLVLSWHAVWSTDPPLLESHGDSKQHSASLLGTVENVSAQV
jgi:hypothetical protein